MLNVLLYYKYVKIENPEETMKEHRKLCESLGLTGRIYIGKEGINGTVSGLPEKIEDYKHAMQSHSLFSGIEFKESSSDFEPFGGKLRIKVRNEIVALGLDVDPLKGGRHITAQEWKELSQRDDVVILDARNDYEFNIGKFKNAITLPIKNFRDFPDALKKIEHLKDKTILTYCTGGIRCEKASVVLKEQGFKEVYQLHGGIVSYGKDMPEDDAFEGTCFVFDNRFKVPVNNNPKIISECQDCKEKSDDVRNCCNAACNKLIIQCSTCFDKTRGGCSSECTTKDRKLLVIQ